MEIFYSNNITDSLVSLDASESAHCVRVLRHRAGDEISVIDGEGTMLHCRLTDANPSGAQAIVISKEIGFGEHPYELSMAVCPTKNIDRYEWFVEKATEFGVDEFVPVIGEHSERKILKTERLERIILSATKQSLKARIPKIAKVQSVREFIESSEGFDLKCIACCFEPEGGRKGISDLLVNSNFVSNKPRIAVLIGPEGDFSEEELKLALSHGWLPISLGQSRLRTETAALASVAAVYFAL